MEYRWFVSDDNSCVVLEVYVPLTKKIAYEAMSPVMKALEENDIKRLLMDLRKAPFIGSVADQYEIVHKERPGRGFKRHWKQAILVAPEDSSHDFFSAAARNAGYKVRIFKDYSEALKWLQS